MALLAMVPKEILDIVDKESLDKTVENFTQYQNENSRGFFYELLNGFNPFYSHDALSKVLIKSTRQ